MRLNLSRLRSNLRLTSGLTMLAFVVCHFTAHATLLVSITFGQAMLTALMAPWRTPPGMAVLGVALAVHYLNALWSIYRRRSLRLSRWELWQLALGFCIPLLLIAHVVGTRVAEQALQVTPTYTSVLIGWWVQQPWLGAVQFFALIVVWVHACIGINFWLRTKPWFATAKLFLGPVALLLPALALAGFITAGNQTRERASADPNFERLILEDSNVTDAGRKLTTDIALAAIVAHLALTMLPFGARAVRGALYRRRRPPTLTHANGQRLIMQPGASVLETLRDNGVLHAAVCGGRARCTTCRVLVTQGLDELPAPEADEARALLRIQASPGTRLACQIYATSDISILPLLSADATATDGSVRGGLEGSERHVTVVFIDLRGSTGIGEARMPYDVLFLLNLFFKEMTDALEASNGHYSQFTGDGLMALYGLQGDPAKGAADAIRGAQDMLKRLDRLNREMSAAMSHPLRIGIGIHFNEAIVGAMGPPKSQIITAIGDTVNTCARLEGLTKDYDCTLIISRQAAEAAGLDLSGETMHEAAVKGRVAKVTFYALNHVPELAAAAV
jgi:adenylate cyclase